MVGVFGFVRVQIHYVYVSHLFAAFNPVENPVSVYVRMECPRATGNTVAALPPSAHKHVTGYNCQAVRVLLCFVSVVYFNHVRVCVVCCGCAVQENQKRQTKATPTSPQITDSKSVRPSVRTGAGVCCVRVRVRFMGGCGWVGESVRKEMEHTSRILSPTILHDVRTKHAKH